MVVTDIVGRKTGRLAGGYGDTQPNEHRLTLLPQLRYAYWIRRIGIRAGRYTSSPTSLTLALNATSGGSPTSRLAQSAAFTVNTPMTDTTSGADYEVQLQAPLRMSSGAVLGAGASSNNGYMHGQDNSGATMWRDYTANPPAATFDIDRADAQGTMNVWIVADRNEPPNRPHTPSPTYDEVTTDTTPTIGATFSDPNEQITGFAATAGDKLLAAQIEVWTEANTRIYASGTVYATGAEQTAKRIARTTPALALGRYYARIRHADLSGAWGEWLGWYFRVSGGGAFTTPTLHTNSDVDGQDPTETPVTNAYSPTFQATWNHKTGLATQSITGQLLYNGAVVRGPTPFTVTGAAGALFTVNFATFGWAALAAGSPGDYRFEMAGTDSAGETSGYAGLTFRVNDRPATPTFLSPAAVTFNAAPKLTARITDPDHRSDQLTPEFYWRPLATGPFTVATGVPSRSGDDYSVQLTSKRNEVQTITFHGALTGGSFQPGLAGSYGAAVPYNGSAADVKASLEGIAGLGLTVNVTGIGGTGGQFYVEFTGTRANTDLTDQLAVRSTLTGTNVSVTTETHRNGTASGELPGNGTYEWFVESYDPYSKYSPTSAVLQFTITDPPRLRITSPENAGEVTVSNPRIDWTLDVSQAKYQIIVDPAAGGMRVFDSGWITSADLFGYIDDQRLRNDQPYRLTVNIEASNGLLATATGTFTVSYARSPAVSATATTEHGQFDTDGAPSFVRLDWTRVTSITEIQEITIAAGVTGGTYTVSHPGAGATDPIAWDATAATVQSVLYAGGIHAAVTKTDRTYRLTYEGIYYGNSDIAEATVDATLLTGTAPGATVATIQQGLTGTPRFDDDFEGWLIDRIEYEGGVEISRERIARIPTMATMTYLDTTPRSGHEQTYEITYLETKGLDVVQSQPATATAIVNLKATVISAVGLFNGYAAVLPTWESRGREPLELASVYGTWDGGSAAYASAQRGEKISGTFQINNRVGSFDASGEDLMETLRFLRSPQWVRFEDEAGVTRERQVPIVICYRDPRGRRDFAVITSCPLEDAHIGWGRCALELTSVSYGEGLAS